MLHKSFVMYIFIGICVIKKVLSTGISHAYNGTNVSKEYPVMPKSWIARTFLIHEGKECICNVKEHRIARNNYKKQQSLDLYSNRNATSLNEQNFSMPLCPPEFCPPFRDYDDDLREKNNKTKSDLNSVETYGYSTLAVLLISLCSIAGVLLIPCLRTRIYKYVITGFIAFGLGFMIGDAVLHLIPEAIGSECENNHEHGVANVALWRQVLIMLTIFGLFTFETIMDLAHHQDKTSHRCPRRHSHSHIPFPEDILPWTEGKTASSSPVHPETPTSPSGPVPFIMHDADAANLNELKPLAIVILLGDAVHNFGDGLAVGAAFTSGLQSGISTSLAIFCHELPHEFGDFVILRSTGLSIQYALLANLASALTAFLGLFVGVSLAFDHSTRQWIFAFTAAMFLYIAVGDMLPELRNHNKSFSVLAVQSASMLVGMAIVLLMHIYVEEPF